MGYKARMKHTRSALLISVGLLGLFPLAGCSKLKTALGKGDDGGAATASGGLLGGKGGAGPLAFLNGFEGEIDVLAKGKHVASKPGAPDTMTLPS